MIPRILIAHTLDWPNAARLAIAFAAADCRVHALCRPGHPVRVISSVDRVHPLNLFAPLRSFRAAIESADPHFILPCDDMAVVHLHRLHQQERESSPASATPIAMLIERSLGDPGGYKEVATRSLLPSVAEAASVLLPRTDVLLAPGDLREWAGREGFPAALKTDRSWGGEGVTIVQSLGGAEEAFRNMSRRPSLIRAMKRIVVNRDPNLFNRKFVDPQPTISIQHFIRGRLSNTAVACWQGEVIAALSVEVVAVYDATGSATVVRPVENAHMLETAVRVTRHLGISGFCGFDFVIEEGTNRAYLIEINPRATQINHMVLGAGHDLPGALRARIAGEPARQPHMITTAETIALFPQEWERNPASNFLTTGYHDIPHEEPALIQASYITQSTRRRSP